MVEVHTRVPDTQTYPPLPDIVLDNLPYLPWAFHFAETCLFIQMFILAIILCFHRYRLIIFRRCAAIGASVFILRTITIFSTSLSVPGKHLDGLCFADKNAEFTFYEKLEKALFIWKGGGLATMGVRSCGDYMFSGHTSMLTILNMAITEYGPNWNWLNTLSWLLNVSGAFFILAAHEHYTLDVIMAFYITSRMFVHYHQLADTGPRHWRNKLGGNQMVRFPLFWFFEGNVNGPVVNLFETPVTTIKRNFKAIKEMIPKSKSD